MCDICEMKKYYAKIFNIHFSSKADCPMKKVCPYDNVKESKKKGDNSGK